MKFDTSRLKGAPVECTHGNHVDNCGNCDGEREFIAEKDARIAELTRILDESTAKHLALEAQLAASFSSDEFAKIEAQLAEATRRAEEANDELAQIRANAERLASYTGTSAEVETLRSALYSVTKERDTARSQFAAITAAAKALVAALPKCDSCNKRVATKAYERGHARWCDDCAERVGPHSIFGPIPDYARAKAALLALLPAADGGEGET